MTLGDIIKKYRTENGSSMEYVANLCGITKGYVAMLEKNVNSKTGRPVKPTIETIVKVCNGLHLDLNTVFESLDDDYEITIPASPATPLQLTKQEEHLVISFRGLNDEGREKAVEYMEDLTGMKKYQSDLSPVEQARMDADEIVRKEGVNPIADCNDDDYERKLPSLFSKTKKKAEVF